MSEQQKEQKAETDKVSRLLDTAEILATMTEPTSLRPGPTRHETKKSLDALAKSVRQDLEHADKLGERFAAIASVSKIERLSVRGTQFHHDRPEDVEAEWYEAKLPTGHIFAAETLEELADLIIAHENAAPGAEMPIERTEALERSNPGSLLLRDAPVGPSV